MSADSLVDVLIPTYNRPSALAVTLTSLCFQDFKSFNIIVSDQGDKLVSESGEVAAVALALKMRGHKVKFLRNLPKRGMAHQRHFLLEKSASPYVLYLDDDLILEPFVLKALMSLMKQEQCGLVGTGTIGLSFLEDERPHEQNVEFWEEKVRPEVICPRSEKWQRHRLHNAANLYHLQRRLKLSSEVPKKYKLAWASACVLYDRLKLLERGGFDFWQDVPPDHCGEDVAAQMRVMSKYGGCGMIPCGVYHQELTTTLPVRKFNIPEELDLHLEDVRLNAC